MGIGILLPPLFRPSFLGGKPRSPLGKSPLWELGAPFFASSWAVACSLCKVALLLSEGTSAVPRYVTMETGQAQSPRRGCHSLLG